MDHSGTVFNKIFLHITWHCNSDHPMITPEIEDILYKYIHEYCNKNKGVYFKAIGGTETHLHLALQIEPFVLVSELVGKIKGASSYEINKKFGKDRLNWQRGYGIVSFAEKNLCAVTKYISNQKIHHFNGTTNKTLEGTTDIDAED